MFLTKIRDGQPIFNSWTNGTDSMFRVNPLPFDQTDCRASTIDPATWWALCTPASGDIPGDY